MAKDWSTKETTYLKRYAASKRIAELAQRLEAEDADVQAKLEELGLAAKDSPRKSRLGNEPLLPTYEEALRALYGGGRAKAAKLFTKVIEECDQPELAERARQMLAVSQREGPQAAQASEDDFLQAVYEKNRGNPERALEIARRGGRTGKDERFAYLEASVHALAERLDEAATALAKAIELDARNRVHAFHDPDFAALRGSREHAGVFRSGS
ncbi:MAG TPA: hypothetical protein VMR44_02225 [Thermoanaerobaculia bacterium]|nr:hypothetical protein [Thermoanaerobaculia bacterium]